MKKFLFATLALVALGATAPALAADLGARPYAPAYATPIYNWTGFYIGGHIGGAISSDSAISNAALSNNNSGRFLAGVQAGADYQFAPNWLVGVEGQYSWLGNGSNGAAFPGGFVFNNDNRALGSITGRVGYTWGPGLVYAKGGYAYSDNQQTLTFGGAPTPFALSGDSRNGYTVGAGLEYMFAPSWSAKVEYMYYNFGSSHFLAPAFLAPFGTFIDDEHTIKAGINYHFNIGGPLVAKY